MEPLFKLRKNADPNELTCAIYRLTYQTQTIQRVLFDATCCKTGLDENFLQITDLVSQVDENLQQLLQLAEALDERKLNVVPE